MQNIEKKHEELDLRLEKHGIHRIETRQSGVVIQCEQGVLWITQSGDRVDHVLYAGDRFTSSKRGRLLIEAMREATMHIASSAQTKGSRRTLLPRSQAA